MNHNVAEKTHHLTKQVYAEHAYAERAAIGERKYQSGSAAIPISPSEAALTLLHRWERMVETYGSNLAVEAMARTLTYRQLNTLANRVAHALLARGLKRDLPVGLLFDLEGDMPVGVLAAWKAGHFFAWFEPRQPLTRNQFIVEESGAKVVVTNRNHEELARQLWPDAGAVIVIEELGDDVPTSNPPIAIASDAPAYLIYTSGSTGQPKGTLELHRNLIHFVAARQNLFYYSSQDRVAFTLFGVGGMTALIGTLMYGSCLLPFQSKYEGLARFNQWLIERRVTMIMGGSDLRNWLVSLDGGQQFPALRLITLGAGPTYREHLQAYQRHLPDDCALINFYSATEFRTSTIALLDKNSRLDGRLVPSGYITTPNTVEIWDKEDRSLQGGETGEVIIISPYVAAGYWKSPQLTAAKFGVDQQGRRFYRTGDLGRLDEQGCLWVLGRIDGQVKIRGNRVETAEVEVALLELPHVKEATVIHIGETDDTRTLLGFVTANAGITGGELRKQLTTRMPDYMVPATIVVLEELPRNATGKVARPLLREMAVAFSMPNRESQEQGTVVQSERVAETVTATQARVASMVSELLGGNPVGAHDNFFDVGGHSLLAARLMLTIHRTFGVDLAPRDFFTDPTIAGLAASVDRELAKQFGTIPVVKTQKSLAIEAVPVLSGSSDHLPIFLCIGRNGSLDILMLYQELIRRLGKQRSLYGLVASGGDDPGAVYSTVDQLVDAALAAVRRVQPRGPYLLIGECIGGKLAYEMARKLTQEGEPVASLTLVDAPSRPSSAQTSSGNPAVKSVNRLARKWYGRFFYHMQQMSGLGWRDGTNYLVERLAAALPTSLHPRSAYRPQYLAHKRYFDLLTQFDPSASYDHAATAIFSREYAHNAGKWAELIPNLEIAKVGGTHNDYLNVSGDQVAAHIRKTLEAAALKKRL